MLYNLNYWMLILTCYTLEFYISGAFLSDFYSFKLFFLNQITKDWQNRSIITFALIPKKDGMYKSKPKQYSDINLRLTSNSNLKNNKQQPSDFSCAITGM